MEQNQNSKYILGFLVVIIGLIFIVKLFFLQVVNTDLKSTAQRNSTKIVNQYPARGLIFDRNGKLMVYNQPAYDLMVTPSILNEIDTAEFIDILNISRVEFLERLKMAKASRETDAIFIRQISSETYAKLQENLYKFHGFFVQGRTLRNYSKKIASHVLGYVGEADQKMVDNDDYYEMGDYIGINGLERSYEDALRGVKGRKIFLVDVHNRIQGAYQDGKQDVDPEVGTDITITLDMDLQEYGEKLMKNKRGSVVAIDPNSGEVLTMISAPTYNPELLVGRNRSKNYAQLDKDTLDPLFNRSLMAYYRPGSTFKLVNGAIALQEQILDQKTKYSCAGAYRSGNVTVGCHNYRSPLTIEQAIQYSSNNFFCQVYRNLLDSKKYESFNEAYNLWRSYVLSYGFGDRLGIDLPGENPGRVPSDEYYNRFYGKNGWKSLTIISMAIGEGELGITPLQLANLGVINANHGYYYSPHIVKKIGNEDMMDKYNEKHYTKIDTSVYDIIVNGMDLVVNDANGTAGWSGLKDIVICGKTGTAQNKDKNDHSVFVAFAPRENPQIAIAVYIEYGGFGGSWAAPLASLMIEKYLTGAIKRKWIEDRIVNAVFLTDEKED